MEVGRINIIRSIQFSYITKLYSVHCYVSVTITQSLTESKQISKDIFCCFFVFLKNIAMMLE